VAAISDLISEVWRETGRHIEIQAATAAIAAAVGRVVPLRGIVVLAVGPGGRTVEPLAVGLVRENDPLALRTHEVSPGAAASLGEWLVEGSIVMTGGGGDSGHAWLTACLPAEIGGDVIAGPLRPDRLDGKPVAAGRAARRAGRPAGSVDAAGILVLLPVTGKTLTAEHAAVAEKLLEPFAVALGNDTRLHELLSLREAAEADRQTLLTRLGKQDVNEDVIGGRTGLKHVMERVELVAHSDVPVLILGDTGTGKEVVSRAIHTRSKRSEGPFIRVNCGAIPPELIDSQLFGHEKGSFTGASEQHKGWFERADRGTLFLDEIGELPLPAQVRLLRVLQDHQIERVGGKSPVRVDVRIVAATHRDLSAMVRERTFREDLWYRVNVFPILLPPLRERVEDIPALVRHFAQRAAGRFGLPAVAPSDADIKLLSAYDWPGNIRELGAVIDRAVILGGGRSLDVAVALGLSRQQRPAPVPPADATLYEVIPESIAPEAQPASSGPGDIVPLATAMRQHIERALAATEGRIEGKRGAAALLEINPHTLRARMRKLGIDPDRFRS
jgi:hydrogenase-4 transcriptional activator